MANNNTSEKLKQLFSGQKNILILTVVVIVAVGVIIFLVSRDRGAQDNNESETVVNHENSGPVLEQDGRFSEAAESYIEDADLLSEQDEFKPSVYESAGDAYNKGNQFDQAAEAYEKALAGYKKQNDDLSIARIESKIERNNVDKLLREEAVQDEQ